MESSLRIIVGMMFLTAGVVVGLVFLYERSDSGSRLRKFLITIYSLAALSVVLFALYNSPTRHLYILALAIVTAFIVERIIDRFRKLTRFGSRLIFLIVGAPILLTIIPIADSIALGIGYFVYIVWNYYSDKDVKEQE
jgi:predicted PurR-regulated permease PerM